MKKRANKKAISEMISYVILIGIAIGLSIGVFIWIKDFANVSPKIDCKEGTSLRIDEITCTSNTIILKVKNNGNFNVNGFIIQASENINQIPTKKLSSIIGIHSPGYYEFDSPLKPSDEVREIGFAKGGAVELIQIQPYIKDETEKIIICEQALIKQDIRGCGLISLDPLSIPGIISWWSLNGDADDENYNDNPGTLYGEVSFVNDAKRGKVASFDGNGDYIQASVAEIKNTTVFWYKNSTATSWTFVANSSGTIYINGNPASMQQYPIYVSGDIVQIGKTGAATYFTGLIDDVMIFNRTLTGSEIKELYEKPYEAPAAPIVRCPNEECEPGLGENFFTCPVDCGLETIPSLVSWWKFDETDGGIASDSKDGNTGNIYGNTKLLMRFDEGSGTTSKDNSSYNNNGAISGATWTGSDCQSGSCLSFDGNDYVTISDSSSLEPKNITIEAWVKGQFSGGDTIINKGSTSGADGKNGWSLRINTANNIQAVIYNGTDSEIILTGTTTLQNGIWYYAALTYDGSYLKIYLNDSQENIVSVTGDIDYTGGFQEVRIGTSRSGGLFWNLTGEIDEVAIYSKALSQPEIQEHFNAGRAKFIERIPGQSGLGNALSFDGIDDYVNAGNNANLNFGAENFTYSAWINTNALNINKRIIAQDGDIPNNFRALIVDASGANIDFWCRDASGTAINVQGSININDGQWHHIAGVREGDTGYVYIDGNPDGSNTNPATGSCDGGVNTFIGARDYSAGPLSFTGSIDEVMIFNQSLDETTIQGIYCAQGGSVGC